MPWFCRHGHYCTQSVRQRKACPCTKLTIMRPVFGRLFVLQRVQLPVLLPGAKQAFVPLSPSLSDEDKQVVENVVKIGEAERPLFGQYS